MLTPVRRDSAPIGTLLARGTVIAGIAKSLIL
jgi:hypothetical protein